MMNYIYIGIIVILAILLVLSKKPAPKKDEKKEENYAVGYKSKWLFSYNEKEAFRVIQKVAAEKGYTALAKVRLYDLVEPKESGNQAYRWKIQAKHVDFVICNEKLVAKWVVELMDSSHKAADREARDTFVKEVLTNCGYQYLETYEVSEDAMREFLS